MTPEQLAAQLRCPNGDDGQQVADNMNTHNQPIITATYEALALKGGESVLEIGPGTAGHLPALLARTADLDYTGLDLSADMVNAATAIHAHLPGVRFVEGDLHQPPLPTEHYQAIVAINVVYFWNPLAPALQALLGLLRPGGQLCLGLRDRKSMSTLPVFQHGFLTYEGPDLEEALAQAGFEEVSLQIIPEESINVMGDVMHKTGLVLCARKPEAQP